MCQAGCQCCHGRGHVVPTFRAPEFSPFHAI
uniref:Zinc/iron-chelating domain-containing protein n=1 Tax=Heterorhabditis bacteriophora TaxID=37862 RepID=A0A1I7W9B0_HETBA